MQLQLILRGYFFSFDLKQILERILAKSLSVKSAALCPSMDLIAIITTDGNLILHRIFAWDVVRRLSSVEMLGIIPSLISFAPRGKLISIGGLNGEVLILDIESGLVMKAMQSAFIRNIATSPVFALVWNHDFPVSSSYDSCPLKWQVWRYGGIDLVQRFGLPNFNEGLEDLSLASPSTDSAMLTAIVNGASGSLLLALHVDEIVIAYVLGISPLFWVDLKEAVHPFPRAASSMTNNSTDANGSNNNNNTRNHPHQVCWVPVAGVATSGIVFIKPANTASKIHSHHIHLIHDPNSSGFSVLFIPATTSFSAASAKRDKNTATTSVGNCNIISTGTSSNTSNTRISASEIHNDVSGRILSGDSFGVRQWGLALTWREKYAALYIRTMEDSRLCEEMLVTCVKKWKDVNKVLVAKVSLLKELISSYELPFSPVEFYHTIAHCGLWHPAAQTCVLQHWNEQGLQRFKMAVDTVFKYFTETFAVRLTSLIVNMHLRCREMLGIDSILFDGSSTGSDEVKRKLIQLSYLSEQLIVKVEEVMCHSRVANYNLLLFAQFIRDFLQSEASDNNTNDTNNGNNVPYCIDATRSAYVKLFEPRLRRLLQNCSNTQNSSSSTMECISNTFLTAHLMDDTVPLDWTEYTLLRNNNSNTSVFSTTSLPLGKVGPGRGLDDAETVFAIVEAVEASKLRQYFPDNNSYNSNNSNNPDINNAVRQKEILQAEGRKSLKGVFKDFQRVFQNLLEVNDAALSAHMSSLVFTPPPASTSTAISSTPTTTGSVSNASLSSSVSSRVLAWQASNVKSLAIRVRGSDYNGSSNDDESMVLLDSPLLLVYAGGGEEEGGGGRQAQSLSRSSDIYCVVQSPPLPTSPLQSPVVPIPDNFPSSPSPSSEYYVAKIAMRPLSQSQSRDSQVVERVHNLRTYVATVADEVRQSVVGIVSVTEPDETALVLLVKYDISDLVFEKKLDSGVSSRRAGMLEGYPPVLSGSNVPRRSRVLDFDISVVEDLVLVECASRGVVAVSDRCGKLLILDMEDHEEESEEEEGEDEDEDEVDSHDGSQ